MVRPPESQTEQVGGDGRENVTVVTSGQQMNSKNKMREVRIGMDQA